MRSTIAMSRSITWLILIFSTVWLPKTGFAAQGLVFQVQMEGRPASYLVGTMHSEDERVTGLLDQFAPLIDRVDVVAVEMVPDAVAMLAVGAATMLPADQRLSRLIGDARFAALSRAASDLGLPAGVLDRLKPWAAAVTLGLPQSRTGRFLDMEIYLHALARERRIVGLETPAEQLAAFDNMALEVQLALLDEMVKNANLVPKQLEELTAVYLEGDLERIDRVARAQYEGLPESVTRWFDEQMLERRNDRMLERLTPLLGETSVLAAVGAMHLAGDNGLVEGLRRLGYRVERR